MTMWKKLIKKIEEDLKEWEIDIKDYDVKLIDGSPLGLRIEINNMHFAYVEERYWDDAAAYILARTIRVFARDLNDEEEAKPGIPGFEETMEALDELCNIRR